MKHIITLFAIGLIASPLFAATSPYATTTSGVPLNQSVSDDINGLLGVGGQTPQSGSLAALTDATTASSPNANVILGADNEIATVTWDFGASIDAALRRLNTVSLWFADDSDRTGYNGSLSISLDGSIFSEIPNSAHEVGFTFAPNQFHNVVYDFTGVNISNFRYIRLNSAGYVFPFPPGNPAFQPRFTEADIFTAVVPEPSTLALFACGAGLLGFSLLRKKNA